MPTPVGLGFFGPAFSNRGRFNPGNVPQQNVPASPFQAQDFRAPTQNTMQSPFLSAFGMKLNPNLAAPEYNSRLKAMMGSVMGGGGRVGGAMRGPFGGMGGMSTVPLEMMRMGGQMHMANQADMTQRALANQNAAMTDRWNGANLGFQNRQMDMQGGLAAQQMNDNARLGQMGLFGQANMAREGFANQRQMAGMQNSNQMAMAQLMAGLQRDMHGQNIGLQRDQMAQQGKLGERALGLEERKAGFSDPKELAKLYGMNPEQAKQAQVLQSMLPMATSDAQRSTILNQIMGSYGMNMGGGAAGGGAGFMGAPLSPFSSLPDNVAAEARQATSHGDLQRILKSAGAYTPQMHQQIADAIGLNAPSVKRGMKGMLPGVGISQFRGARQRGVPLGQAAMQATPAYQILNGLFSE